MVKNKDKKNHESENQPVNEPENIENENVENSNNENLLEKEEEILVNIGQLENEISDLKDKLLRKAAEFENYKRRTENDQLNLLKYSAEPFIVKLLPVVDDFERSIDHMDSAKDIKSIKEGVMLIYNKLMKILSEQGVEKIEAIGKPFDVEYHEAMLQRKVPQGGIEPHTVLDEIEKGYMYKDKVIRHSKVIVSEDVDEESASN
ncbi:MAG: nucleotide exchange factor GrpE [Ignavibacteriaceae bacterium]